ncbi:hypothetical protein [Acetivibrio sp. MSJd-27]|uniref:hypothetical protein n=1 Tax=Acetivibrio sp. MSJd-27 TaxID=2841523 RepID=UPI001C10534E|nr:hypothetical protein [Acetivibrio sp. MSJd-27]MBU5451524.1 hypothetical protein [Acetivibrio sp. MSJd-27]
MSNYTTAVVYPAISSQKINRIGKKNNLIFTLIDNSFIKKQLLNKDIQYYLVEWIKDEYNIPIGKMESFNIESKTLDNLSKILNDSEDYFIQLIEKEKKKKSYAIQQSSKNWTQFLKDFFSENSNSKIGLLSHWYNGLIETEELLIKKVSKLIINKSKESYTVEQMENDVLYIFEQAQGNV